MSSFNGEMLRLARELRGHTQRDLAAELKAEPSTLSRIENGLIQPGEELLSRVASFLRLPPEFFTQSESVYGLPISVHPMWRKKAAVSQREIDKALAGFNLRMLHLRRFLKAIEYKPVTVLPEYDVESYEGDIERIAGMVRQAWQLPSGPVRDLTSWVERAGCFVIHVDLPDGAMAGVTMRVPDLRPCIFINRSMPADRMRFTLAHELGHLIMHKYPTKDMEREADTFAAALLMPEKDIRPVFQGRKVDLRLLAALKPEWQVAMQSLLMRACDLGYVSDNQAKYLWMQFNANKIKLREPPELDFEPERPSLLPKLLALHLNELGYSTADLASIARLYEEEVIELYGLSKARPSGLRLVK